MAVVRIAKTTYMATVIDIINYLYGCCYGQQKLLVWLLLWIAKTTCMAACMHNNDACMDIHGCLFRQMCIDINACHVQKICLRSVYILLGLYIKQ
jgi:hypothetical protein